MRSNSSSSGTSNTASWNQLLQDIYGNLQNYQNPYLQQLEGLTQQWLSPDYQAYTPEQLQQWYEQGKQQLEGDVFKEWDEGYGRQMANQNIAGSGVGDISYGKILGQKGGALADLWGGIQQFAEQARRSDIERATSLLPVMSQLKNLPLEQQMQLFNILTSERASAKQSQAQNNAGLGAAIAGIVNALAQI